MRIKHFTLLQPRYWPTWLGLGILYGISKLPYTTQLTIGKSLGHLAFYLLKRFRRIGAINLALCFPELSIKERKILLKKNFASLGIGLVESAMAWWTPAHKLTSLLYVEGLEHLHEALTKKQGI